jgi:nucleoside-diphosphate-sugar epimerase
VLLEAVRKANPGAKIVYPGSRLEYGRVSALPVDEDCPMNPVSIDGVHKLAAEKYHVLYHRVYGLRTTVLRITNPYGAGQPPERVDYGIVNRFIQLALAGKALPLYGDGRQLRDYVFVGDVVEAMLLAGASEAADGKVFNVGSGQGTPMVEMAALIVRKTGNGRIDFVPWPPLALAVETGDFVADIRHISRGLGWKLRVGLEEGIDLTIAAVRWGSTA